MKFRNQVIFSDDMIFGRVIIPITIPAGRALFLSSVPSHFTNIICADTHILPTFCVN